MFSSRLSLVRIRGCGHSLYPGKLPQTRQSGKMARHNITALTHELMKPMANENQRHEGSRVMKRESLQRFALLYEESSERDKLGTLLFLSNAYGSDQQAIYDQCRSIGELTRSERQTSTLLSAQQRLSQVLKPIYHALLTQLGTLDNGVKFLIDMRYDVLQSLKKKDLSADDLQTLKYLSGHIGDILSMWFSVGLLQLRRITWETSAGILEKVAKYEAVHAIKNWMDLKYRLGPNRRCYAFFHASMPTEPVIVLHVALTKEITDNITEILDYRSCEQREELTSDARCAIFYSITSTQKGLQGIELGAYLIQSVVASLKQELSHLTTFSSLSPIPGFRKWLLREPKEVITHSLKFADSSLLTQVMDQVRFEGDMPSFLREVARNLEYFRNENVTSAVKNPMMKLCATYLCKVKRRSYALDPVANFHLKNGAVVWRVNWMADKSSAGMQQSCGLMVNYRYYLENMVENSSNYITNHTIPVSDTVNVLLQSKNSNL